MGEFDFAIPSNKDLRGGQQEILEGLLLKPTQVYRNYECWCVKLNSRRNERGNGLPLQLFHARESRWASNERISALVLSIDKFFWMAIQKWSFENYVVEKWELPNLSFDF